jgi:hypothetical protein
MFLHDGLCGRAEITSSRVIAETLPAVQNFVLRSGGKSGEIGEAPHPLIIVWDDRGDLRLLEHELGHQDRVGISGTTPGEIAALFPIPGEEGVAERSGVRGRVHADRMNVQRPTSNVELQRSDLDVGRWTLDVGRSLPEG